MGVLAQWRNVRGRIWMVHHRDPITTRIHISEIGIKVRIRVVVENNGVD